MVVSLSTGETLTKANWQMWQRPGKCRICDNGGVMKNLGIEAIFTYDDELMHSSEADEQAKKWFREQILFGEDLILHSNEVGDSIGKLKIVSIQDPDDLK